MRKLEKRIADTLKDGTKLVIKGRKPDETFGFVNVPPYRGSTVVYPDAESCLAGRNTFTYGRRGNPTSAALEELWNELEGSAGTVICPSGASAVSIAILSAVQAGDHILMVDSVYRPTRNFCDNQLTRYGVETTYYDPLVGADIAGLIRPNTRAIYMESPGSQTFEVQDVPAIVTVAKARGITTLMDNTYATALLFRPLDFGIDVSINAATKYPTGHSDVLIGLVAANEAHFPKLKAVHGDFGLYLGPDDVYLTLRGLRTMGLRLREQGANALAVARALEQRPGVKRVLHPGLPSNPGHALFMRDFKGPSGLFSIILEAQSDREVIAFLDELLLFGMGYSWGGYESLAVPFDCTPFRTATVYNPGGRGVRFNIGLEDPEDLIADLDRGLAAMRAVQQAG
jgi:cystathionine beta-lyase